MSNFDETAERAVDALERLTHILEKRAAVEAQIADDLHRLVGFLTPPPADIVGTPHVAALLGQTTTWVAEMARDGKIPPDCIVKGSGYGKPWRFYRGKIDRWIADGRPEALDRPIRFGAIDG